METRTAGLDTDAVASFVEATWEDEIVPQLTDYIAIPAVIVSVSTLVIVSLLTPKPLESDWKEFMGGGEPEVPVKP